MIPEIRESHFCICPAEAGNLRGFDYTGSDAQRLAQQERMKVRNLKRRDLMWKSNEEANS